MPIQNGDILQVRLTTQQGNQVAFNLIHYRCSGAGGVVPSHGQVAAHLSGILSSNYKGCLVSSATFRGLDVRTIAPVVTAASEYIGDAGVGAVTGDAMSRQTCGVITKKTALAGQANRGRVYVPFPSEQSNDTTGSPTSAYLALLVALAADLLLPTTVVNISPAGQVDLTPVLYHPDSASSTDIVDFVQRPRWGTQRSRGDYGALNIPPY